jgi:hypothetical protein
MTTKFWLLAQPRWSGFKLQEEGKEKEEERKFDAISEAFDYVRALPHAQGAVLIVLDEQGKEMASLTV